MPSSSWDTSYWTLFVLDIGAGGGDVRIEGYSDLEGLEQAIKERLAGDP